MLDLRAQSDYLATFDHCYRVMTGFGMMPHFERLALPQMGGVLEQDAHIMAALELIERVSNEELQETLEGLRKTKANDDV